MDEPGDESDVGDALEALPNGSVQLGDYALTNIGSKVVKVRKLPPQMTGLRHDAPEAVRHAAIG